MNSSQQSKSVKFTFQVLSPEGWVVHSCASKSDAYRVADRFTHLDGVRHTVRPTARSNRREEF